MPGIPNIWPEEIGTADCDTDDQCKLYLGFDNAYTASFLLLMLSVGGLAIAMALLIYSFVSEQRQERERQQVLQPEETAQLVDMMDKLRPGDARDSHSSASAFRESSLLGFTRKAISSIRDSALNGIVGNFDDRSAESKFGSAGQYISGEATDAIAGLEHVLGLTAGHGQKLLALAQKRCARSARPS